MDLFFNKKLAETYHSASQRARVLTESWVVENMFCPRCGNLHLSHFGNNRPVADFYCSFCKNEYELKSKTGPLDKKVNDGAYYTMIERITGNKNPDFFFMNYSKENQCVKDFIVIPKHFFVPDIIEKRKPLSETARRAGWVGCNILIGKVPQQGRIEVIKNGKIAEIDEIVKKVNRGKALEIPDIKERTWLMDVLFCINQAPTEFSLAKIYEYTHYLSSKHPKNNNIQAKIRQQMQILRDLGFIEFLGKGKYRKV
ncbi:MAG: restriction endonuclease [Clostridia bacterium]|nr:restriction endonuclease [Clostridia bacterium]